jgi:predicted GIY-YIG superfamily endonuclease
LGKDFFYVYILVSLSVPARHYTGWTEDLNARLKQHVVVDKYYAPQNPLFFKGLMAIG